MIIVPHEEDSEFASTRLKRETQEFLRSSRCARQSAYKLWKYGDDDAENLSGRSKARRMASARYFARARAREIVVINYEDCAVCVGAAC